MISFRRIGGTENRSLAVAALLRWCGAGDFFVSHAALRNLRGVFRSAFGLNLGCFENTVGSQASLCQGLRIVAECIRQRVGSRIDYVQCLCALVKDKGDLRPMLNNRA